MIVFLILLGRSLEIGARSAGLTSVQRRLLILIDGKRTINDLGAFVRVGDLDGALEQLFALRLVVAAGAQVALQPPAITSAAIPARSDLNLMTSV